MLGHYYIPIEQADCVIGGTRLARFSIALKAWPPITGQTFSANWILVTLGNMRPYVASIVSRGAPGGQVSMLSNMPGS